MNPGRKWNNVFLLSTTLLLICGIGYRKGYFQTRLAQPMQPPNLKHDGSNQDRINEIGRVKHDPALVREHSHGTAYKGNCPHGKGRQYRVAFGRDVKIMF